MEKLQTSDDYLSIFAMIRLLKGLLCLFLGRSGRQILAFETPPNCSFFAFGGFNMKDLLH